MDNEGLLIIELKKDLQIELAEKISLEEIKEKLTAHINYLITNRFEELATLLYKIDVDENKLRKMLHENTNEDAGNLIANLIIERQLQKIKTRKEFSGKKNENDAEERW